MYRHTFSALPIAVFIFISALFQFVPFTYAESVLWNATRKINPIFEPNISITYHTRVIDADTGSNVPCGSTVPVGTRLRYEFVPHRYEHIYWFAPGGTFDSPYGDWIADGGWPQNVCAEKNYWSSATYYNGPGGAGGIMPGVRQFVALSTNPPKKSIAGLGGLTCTSIENDSVQCTADVPGSFSPSFDWEPTFGHFYWGYAGGQVAWLPDRCRTGVMNEDSWDPPGIYTLEVPAQSLSCPIRFSDAIGSPPDAPVLSAGGACVIGEPHIISMKATDPDGDALRYAIDWNADGTIDQYLPGSGYVNSGVTRTIARTYALAGSKTLKVLAQDKEGNASAWSTLTFACAGSQTASFNAGNGVGGGNGNEPISIAPDLELRVIPSLVKSGATTKVNWSANGVRTCSVTAPNGDGWNAVLSVIGGETSSPITGETTYTLSCLDLNGGTLTKQAKVRIIPTFQEK